MLINTVMSTRGGGSGSGLGDGTEPIDKRMRELISFEIRDSLEQSHVIFNTVNEGIMEILDERLGAFCTDIMVIMGSLTLSFQEFRACGAPEFFREKDPIGHC